MADFRSGTLVVRSRQKHPMRSGESAHKIKGQWFKSGGTIRLI